MKKRILITLIVLFGLAGCAEVIEQPLKIGAILPLSGPAAWWGEQVRNGMDVAIQELAEQGMTIDTIYEDSKAQSAEGVTAYNKLNNIDDVDVVFSIFSRVSIPLVSLADEDNLPLIMSIVAAKDAPAKSMYAFRFYATSRQYADPHFDSIDKEIYDKIAVLYVNDEYGTDINRVVLERAQEKGIEIVSTEAFDPGTTDFRTHLLKIKSKNPKALVFIGATPPETINSVQQMRELKLDVDFIETAPLLSAEPILKAVGEAAEGAITTAFPFTLEQTGSTFRQKYKMIYGEEPAIPAAFGYDMVKLVVKASNGKSSEDLAQKIADLKQFESLNGPIDIQSTGEINPELYSVKIVDGKLTLY